MNFSEWFDKNFKTEFVEDGQYQKYTLCKKEVAGSYPSKKEIADTTDTIDSVAEIVFEMKNKEIKDLKLRIKDQEQGVLYQPCSGCHETVDGHCVGEYPFSERYGCIEGAGCSECEDTGVVQSIIQNTEDDLLDEAFENLINVKR